MSCVTTVRRYFTRAAKRNGPGGAGLIGTSHAWTSGSPFHARISRPACTAWPPRIPIDGATIAMLRGVSGRRCAWAAQSQRAALQMTRLKRHECSEIMRRHGAQQCLAGRAIRSRSVKKHNSAVCRLPLRFHWAFQYRPCNSCLWLSCVARTLLSQVLLRVSHSTEAFACFPLVNSLPYRRRHAAVRVVASFQPTTRPQPCGAGRTPPGARECVEDWVPTRGC